MSDSLKTLLVIAFLIVIVWNLGAGLYYLLVDRGQTKRTVNALTRRIAVSVALIVLVIVSIYMGWIKPHGIGSGPHVRPGSAGGRGCRRLRLQST